MKFEKYKSKIAGIYGNNEEILAHQYSRYYETDEIFVDKFGECTTHHFSSPGRVELGGNHTDHNNGCVLAASISNSLVSPIHQIVLVPARHAYSHSDSVGRRRFSFESVFIQSLKQPCSTGLRSVIFIILGL